MDFPGPHCLTFKEPMEDRLRLGSRLITVTKLERLLERENSQVFKVDVCFLASLLQHAHRL